MDARVLRIHGEGDLRVEDDTVAPPGPGEVLVAIERGGICGSDLHYLRHGRAGASILRAPMVLGHEVAGRVAQTGEGCSLPVGTVVTVDPSEPCGVCRFCRAGLPRHCISMRFLGSAMFFPHEDGGFRDAMVVPERRCVVMEHASVDEAACTEPLSVCLHAAHQAPSLLGARVLVTGAGPIGALITGVARAAGAAEIVVTDVAAHTLDVAKRMGATTTVLAGPGALDPWSAEKGQFDVVFECSGAAAAIAAGVGVLRPGGTMVQVGIGSEVAMPLGMMVAKEIQFVGSFRFDAEFAAAAKMIDSGAIDVTPVLSATLPLEHAAEAFELAGDRTRAVKVQLAFGS